MKIYTVEIWHEDYYAFSQLIASTVSLDRAIEIVREQQSEWLTITECDGFTGKPEREATYKYDDQPNATKENLVFEAVKK